MRHSKGGIKAWLIFILVVAVVFGALFYLRGIYTKPLTTDEEISEETKKPSRPFALPELTEETKFDIDNTALKGAFDSGDISDCEKIQYDEELKQKCLDALNYAGILRSGDETQCEKLFDPKMRQQCYDSIYNSAALDKFDINLCYKIQDPALQQSCINKIQVVMGRTATDRSFCDAIVDDKAKQDCLDNFYLSSGIKDLDEESCDNITDPNLKNRCTTTIAQNLKVIEKSKQAVIDIPKTTEEILASCTTPECQDQMNYTLANEKKDINYCYKISDSKFREECVNDQTKSINQYYLRQAVTLKDPSICENITNVSLKDLCKSSVGN